MGFTGGGGLVSPVTLDPIEFAGAVTFDKDVTMTADKKLAWPAPSVVQNNTVSLGDVAGSPYVGMTRTGSKPMQIFDYQGIELRGARVTGGIPTPSPADIAGTAVINTVAATKAMVIRGAVAQSTNLLEWQDSAGTTLAYVTEVGTIRTNGYLQANSASAANLAILGYDAVAGATGPAVSFGNGFDATFKRLAAGVMGPATGQFLGWLAGNEQATVGAAGAAAAVPATPTKYLKVKDSAGTTLVIPAFAAA